MKNIAKHMAISGLQGLPSYVIYQQVNAPQTMVE